MTKRVYSGTLITPESDGFVSDDNLFNYQAKIIKELAETQNCVIVGRCADFVLKDYDTMSHHVFTHAPMEFNIERALERNNMSRKEMIKFIEKTSKYRGDYYKYYTGHEWNDARNYDFRVLTAASLALTAVSARLSLMPRFDSAMHLKNRIRLVMEINK